MTAVLMQLLGHTRATRGDWPLLLARQTHDVTLLRYKRDLRLQTPAADDNPDHRRIIGLG